MVYLVKIAIFHGYVRHNQRVKHITPIKIYQTYCGWKKSCTTLDGWTPINNGTNHLSTGAGFLPSTVWGWVKTSCSSFLGNQHYPALGCQVPQKSPTIERSGGIGVDWHAWMAEAMAPTKNRAWIKQRKNYQENVSPIFYLFVQENMIICS